MNSKENWLRTLNNDSPEWIPTPWEPFRGNFFKDIAMYDPIAANAGGARVVGTPYKDGWGVSWLFLEGDPGATPYINDETKVLKDVTAWEDVVTFPELDGFDWTEYENYAATVDRNEHMIMSFVPAGLFERSHYLMGFEDALVNYMVEQDAMNALISAIADWKIGHLERLIDHLNPDVIHFHDDWGNKANLFMPPDIWRQIIKPHQKRIVDCVKSKGVIFQHHADCICEPVVEDMVEIGIDMWQGVIPQNDIPGIQQRIGNRMAMMGGIDAQIIDKPEHDEETIRQEVRTCIDTYCDNGSFFPCIPNVVPLYNEVDRIYTEEIREYGRKLKS